MTADGPVIEPGRRRLSKADRRRQLLDTARAIARSDGVDRLTLGRLAVVAGVSKPVAYDHFQTRSGLLIELYRTIDTDRVELFRRTMEKERPGAGETVALLAAAYIRCAGATGDEFQAVGSALGGSPEKAEVFQELLANSVGMFVAVLEPHSALAPDELHRLAIALVGAGEALAAAMVRGDVREAEAIRSFSHLIGAGLSRSIGEPPG